MKKYILIPAVLAAVSLTACGMSPEDISSHMTELESSYQNGSYDKASSEEQKLDKAYKNMTDEQKAKFSELKSNVDYAVSSHNAITESLNNAQIFYNQSQYYEANQVLENIAASYTLPPAEFNLYNQKKTAVDAAITSIQIDSSLQNIASQINSGDYNSALNGLTSMNTSALSNDQSQYYQTLLAQAGQAKANAEAQAKAAAEAQVRAAKAAKAAAEQREKDNAVLGYYDGDYHYNGKAVGKGTLKSYMNGEISKEQFEREMNEYNAAD